MRQEVYDNRELVCAPMSACLIAHLPYRRPLFFTVVFYVRTAPSSQKRHEKLLFLRPALDIQYQFHLFSIRHGDMLIDCLPGS